MKLIHSIDPHSLPVVDITIFTHVVRTSVTTFQICANQNRLVIATGGIVGLAERIIDDIRLVFSSLATFEIFRVP